MYTTLNFQTFLLVITKKLEAILWPKPDFVARRENDGVFIRFASINLFIKNNWTLFCSFSFAVSYLYSLKDPNGKHNEWKTLYSISFKSLYFDLWYKNKTHMVLILCCETPDHWLYISKYLKTIWAAVKIQYKFLLFCVNKPFSKRPIFE